MQCKSNTFEIRSNQHMKHKKNPLIFSDGLWEPKSTDPLTRHGVEERGAEKEKPLPLYAGSSGG